MRSGTYPKEEFRVEDFLIEFLKRNSTGEVGAIFVFIGKVKREGKKGRVSKLFLEAYVEQANEELTKICEELRGRYGVRDVEIAHGLGGYEPGESIVYVAISSKGRGEGLECLREAIELYKSRPAIFKKEIYENGAEEWV